MYRWAAMELWEELGCNQLHHGMNQERCWRFLKPSESRVDMLRNSVLEGAARSRVVQVTAVDAVLLSSSSTLLTKCVTSACVHAPWVLPHRICTASCFWALLTDFLCAFLCFGRIRLGVRAEDISGVRGIKGSYCICLKSGSSFF